MTTTNGRATRRASKKGYAAKMMAVLVAVLAVIGATLAFATGPASATKDVRVTICHATSSHENPYVEITVRGSSIDEVQNELYNGHGDHTGPVYDPAAEPAMEDWGDIIPAYGTFPGINPTAQVEGCTVGVEEDYDASQPYCAVDATTLSGYVLDALEVTGYPTQDLADKALVDLAEYMAVGIIPAFTAGDYTFDGLNWDTAGQTLFAADCIETPPPPPPPPPPESVKYGATVPFCEVGGTGYVPGTLTVPVTYNTQDDANIALSALVATTTGIVDPGYGFGAANWTADNQAIYNGGLCNGTVPVAVTAVVPEEPVVVAVPEPATVAEPETVAVPQPATIPAAVPAGGGSTAPDQTLPIGLLVLTALGVLGLAGSAIRLVGSRSG